MGHQPQRGPPDKDGLVRRSIKRGFSRTWLNSTAAKLLKEIDDETKRLRQQANRWLPADTWEVFDRLGLERPQHLAPYVNGLASAVSQRVRLVFSAPPQHGKTTATLCILLFLLLVQPERQHAYVTYSQSRSNEVYKDFCSLLDKAELGYDRADGVVRLVGTKGCVRFTSVEGGLTGYTVDGIAVVDDPVKNASEARSKTVRDNVGRFFNMVLETREMGDLSIVVMMTRWDDDDISGRLLKRGWVGINLTAICDSDGDPLGRQPGEALWPSRHPVARLLEFKENNPREFAAMYQGDPSPEGLRLFNAETTYLQWSPRNIWVSYGIDVSYGKRKGSDFSTCVRLVTDMDANRSLVERVLRMQGDMRDFCRDVRQLQDNRDGPVFWATGGPNEGTLVAALLRERGIRRLSCYPARISKRARAQDVADAWNQKRVGVPARQDQPMRDFVQEVTRFTGDDRDHDDLVDALASAYRPIKQRGMNVASLPVVSEDIALRGFFVPAGGHSAQRDRWAPKGPGDFSTRLQPRNGR